MDEEYFIDCIDGDDFFIDHHNRYRVWLNDTIGRSNWQFHGAGSKHPFSIRFERREDALAFKLKFGL
jgi:hypothetical protein